MSDEADSSAAAMGGLTLYSGDTDIPDYASSVGSSVSQSKENTVQVNAAMFNNAMTMLLNLQTQVYFYFHLFVAFKTVFTHFDLGWKFAVSNFWFSRKESGTNPYYVQEQQPQGLVRQDRRNRKVQDWSEG